MKTIKEPILYVDDVKENLDSFRLALGKKYDIQVASSAKEGLAILSHHKIKVAISDQGMPDMTGLLFFNELLKLYPDIICIILTSYCDIESVVMAVNQGNIFRYLMKPWTIEEMVMTINSALCTFQLKEENTRLIENLRARNLELSQTVQLLKESEEKYRTIFTHSPVGIFRATTDGKFIELNHSLAQMLGYQTPEQAISSITDIAKDIYVYPDKRMKIVDSMLRKDTVAQYENIYKRCDGSQFVGLLILKSVNGANGETLFFEGIVEDITERKLYEQALINAKEQAIQADRMKSAFLANVSHEIRTPMNGIIGFAQLLKKPNIHPDKQGSYIDLIYQSGEQLLAIIDDLLDISKLEAGFLKIHRTQFELNSFLDDLINFYQADQHKFHRAIDLLLCKANPNDQIQIVCDRNRLKQIITNLIDNALKFTTKGHIKLGYQIVDNSTISFSVEDTGIGIPIDKQRDIFERFKQVDGGRLDIQSGCGLGLSIAKGLVILLGGNIWVESEIDQGSTFFFTISTKITILKSQ